MSARTRTGWCLVLSLTAGVWAAPQLRAEESGKSGKAGCVDYHADAPYAGLGYNHVVTLKSNCKVAMSCSVTTNVNPDPTAVDLGPGEEKSVVTWRGSPASVFTPSVSCKATPPAQGG